MRASFLGVLAAGGALSLAGLDPLLQREGRRHWGAGMPLRGSGFAASPGGHQWTQSLE